MSKYKVTGRKWDIGSIVYLVDDRTPDFRPYELKVRITEEQIAPKYGRGQEWGYFYTIIDSTKNFPHHNDIEYYKLGSYTSGKNFHKNPKLKW